MGAVLRRDRTQGEARFLGSGLSNTEERLHFDHVLSEVFRRPGVGEGDGRKESVKKHFFSFGCRQECGESPTGV